MKINKNDVIKYSVYAIGGSGLIAWALYLVYVFQYGFNMVISPIFNIGQITYGQAIALDAVWVYMNHARAASITAVRERLKAPLDWKTFIIMPVVIHFIIWLCVG